VEGKEVKIYSSLDMMFVGIFLQFIALAFCSIVRYYQPQSFGNQLGYKLAPIALNSIHAILVSIELMFKNYSVGIALHTLARIVKLIIESCPRPPTLIIGSCTTIRSAPEY
jgi:hypothetical protein